MISPVEVHDIQISEKRCEGLTKVLRKVQLLLGSIVCKEQVFNVRMMVDDGGGEVHCGHLPSYPLILWHYQCFVRQVIQHKLKYSYLGYIFRVLCSVHTYNLYILYHIICITSVAVPTAGTSLSQLKFKSINPPIILKTCITLSYENMNSLYSPNRRQPQWVLCASPLISL